MLNRSGYVKTSILDVEKFDDVMTSTLWPKSLRKGTSSPPSEPFEPVTAIIIVMF